MVHTFVSLDCAVFYKITLSGAKELYMSWKELIFPEFEVRKTKAQKSAFIGMLKSHFGDRMRLEEEGSIIKSRNIIIGDPEKAEIIFTAHYDTCARLPFPNFITPKNTAVYILYQLLITAALFIPPLLLSTAAALFSDSLILTEAAMILTLIAEVWLIMAGPANRHTANDNTSGVVTVLTLSDVLDDGRAAFVLFDNEEIGLFGSSAFVKRHDNLRKNGFIINFDCVSDGDNFLFYYRQPKKAEKHEIIRFLEDNAGRILCEYGKTPVITSHALYPSDQALFKNWVAVASLKKSKTGILYMDKIHTDRDTSFDDGNITSLVRLFTGRYEAENPEK